MTYFPLGKGNDGGGTGGAVSSVEGNLPDSNGDVKLPDMATKQELQTVDAKLDEHKAENARILKTKQASVNKQSTQRPLITFIDDDGTDGCYSVLKPMMDARGFIACSAVVSDFVGAPGYMSIPQIKSLQDDGWEIMSHSATHPRLGDLTADKLPAEIRGSKNLLIAEGLDISGFVYPFGNHNADVRSMVSETYDYAFAGWGFNEPPIKSTSILRVTLGEDESLTLANFKLRVDQAIAGNLWLVFCFHINATSTAQRQILSDLLDYIQTKSLEVVTARDALKAFGNMLEVRNEEVNNYFAVGADGKPYGTGLLINVDEVNARKATDPVANYPRGLTVTTITSSHSSANGFPNG